MTDLYPTFRFGSLELTQYPFAVPFGRDFGNPKGLVTEVISALTEGSLTQRTGTENREVTIPVMVMGADLLELAESEAMLVAEAQKERNEFAFNPGDGIAVDSVYDTYAADLAQEHDDNHDINFVRIYSLTFAAYPWPRSSDKVITPAVGIVAPTAVDSGSSTSGWSATEGPTGTTVTVVSGAVTATYNAATVRSSGYYGTSLTRAGSIDTSVNKLIGIDWKSSVPAVHSLNMNGNPFANEVEVRREPIGSGYTRSWYRVADSVSSVSTFRFGIVHPKNSSASATLSVDQVVQANALPVTGTARQITRIIQPGGSITAEGDVIVQHATAGLGQTIVFSHPAGGGYSPPLRQWRSDGPTPVADSATVSGFRNSLATTRTLFKIPFDALPQGDAQLWVRVRQTTGFAGTVGIGYGVGSDMNGYVPDAEESETRFLIPDANIWTIVPLGRVTLPPRTLGPAGFVRVALLRSTVHDLELDEAWLFAMDRGRLTVVDCGAGTPATGTAHNRLVVSAPSLERPFGDLVVGTAADLSDTYAPQDSKITCPQVGHRFNPDGGSAIFTVTTGTTDAQVSLEHYPRWHTNAAS